VPLGSGGFLLGDGVIVYVTTVYGYVVFIDTSPERVDELKK
jgi:hypothetical protein